VIGFAVRVAADHDEGSRDCEGAMICTECGRLAALPVPCEFGVRCRLCHEKLSDRELREEMRRKDLKRGRNWLRIIDKESHSSAKQIERKRG